jgi:ABC-type transporter Mla maintaining outer membrane lipid asymmetry permease subunit MlaE
MDQDQQSQLYLMIGEIKATNSLILKTLQDHYEERKALAAKVEELNSKVNRAAAILTLATVFIGAVFNQGLRKLGIIS